MCLAFFPWLIFKKIQNILAPRTSVACYACIKNITNIKKNDSALICSLSHIIHILLIFFPCVFKAKYFIGNRKFIVTRAMITSTAVDKNIMCCWVGICWHLWSGHLFSPGVQSDRQPNQTGEGGGVGWGVCLFPCHVHLLRTCVALARLLGQVLLPHEHLYGSWGQKCWWEKEHCHLWQTGFAESWIPAKAEVLPWLLQATGICLRTVFYHSIRRFMDHLCPYPSSPCAQDAHFHNKAGTSLFWFPSLCWSLYAWLSHSSLSIQKEAVGVRVGLCSKVRG